MAGIAPHRVVPHCWLSYVSLITSLLVFSTLDRFRANSQLQAVQCRICPFPVIIQVTIRQMRVFFNSR